jgi:hypothetical protein
MASDQKPSDGLLESRPFYKNLSFIVTLLLGLSALIGYARGWLTRTPPAPPNVFRNVEIIIDRSEQMNDLWDGERKLTIAQAAASSFIIKGVATGENLGLRQFGGPCDESGTSLVVPFAKNNKQSVQSGVDALSAAGMAPLYGAVKEAIGDFEDLKNFGSTVKKRILVIAGSSQICDASQKVVIQGKLSEDAKANSITLNFNFIGLGLKAKDQQELKDLADITHGTAFFPAHPKDVEELVARVFDQPAPAEATPHVMPPEITAAPQESEKASVRQDTSALKTSVQSGETDLSNVMLGLEKNDLAAARKALQAARQDEERSGAALASLRQGRREEQFPELLKAISKYWTLHRKLVDLADVIVRQFHTDTEGYRASSAEYKQLTDEFDRTKKQIDELLKGL